MLAKMKEVGSIKTGAASYKCEGVSTLKAPTRAREGGNLWQFLPEVRYGTHTRAGEGNQKKKPLQLI
jgi:hypothetical protein